MRKFLVVLSILFLGVLSSCFLPYKSPLGSDVKIENLTQVDFTDSLKSNGPLTQNNLPSTGNVDVLVVPISFNPTLDMLNRPNLLTDIDKAFNGNIIENGYYSVSEFYKISSYNQLNLNFDVLDFYYQPLKSQKFYESYGDGMADGSSILFREVVTNLDDKINFSKYDSDSDGFVDAVWMVYTNPVDFKYGQFWWAYVTSEEVKTNDNVKALYYGFAGTDFLYPNKDKNEAYDPKDIKLDSHTFIHETGHLFGLDDYYDYDDNFSATYGIDYMDLNYGDHGPISKLLLNWVNPIIVNDSCDVVIKPYQTSGEVYLVTDDFHNTIYDSYYLIINYSDDLLYKRDPYFFNKNNGILIYKVNAQKNLNSNNEVSMNGGRYYTGFKYDNTDGKTRFVEIMSNPLTSNMFKVDLLFTEYTNLYLSDAKININVKDVLPNKNINVSFVK